MEKGGVAALDEGMVTDRVSGDPSLEKEGSIESGRSGVDMM